MGSNTSFQDIVDTCHNTDTDDGVGTEADVDCRAAIDNENLH